MAEAIGKRIIIEGLDGTGKSYQARRLYARLAENGIKMCGFMIDEPDGAYSVDSVAEVMESEQWTDAQKWERILVPESTILRRLVKDKNYSFTTEQNIRLFTESRLANWHQATLPALNRGETTVTARSDVSTTVYQGYAEGYGMDEVREITRQKMGQHYMEPDLLIILDFMNEADRHSRLEKRDSKSSGDAFESRPNDFQQAIREGYRIHPDLYGGIILPADGNRNEVHEAIWSHARHLFDL